MMRSTVYAVSACLAGMPCRYTGTSHPCAKVIELVVQGKAVPLCPEVLGGLSVPRMPCELRKGKVIDAQGHDHTQAFMLGAKAALDKALQSGATAAILKSRSPSCGVGAVYDGSFSKKLVPSHGLWAELLCEAGFCLFTEESLPPPEDGTQLA